MSRNVLFGNALLFIAYYISAHFTLALSLPPSGATPLWVPSGIALGAVLVWGLRLLPSIFLADFVIGIELVGLSDFTSVIICTLMGLQAAGHCWLAWSVLRKHRLWPSPLNDERNIFMFLLISTGITLALTSLVFVISEWALGILPSSQLISTFLLWWAGGALGIILFTPLMLVFFAKPRANWKGHIHSVAVPLIILFVFLISSLFYVKVNQEQHVVREFGENRILAQTIQNEQLAVHALLLKNMQAFYQNSDSVSDEEFTNYISDYSTHRYDIYSEVWIEYVADADRDDYEKEHGYPIITLDESQTNFVPAPRKPFYYVVRSIHWSTKHKVLPNNNNSLLGWDVCSDVKNSMSCLELSTFKDGIVAAPLLISNEPEFVYVAPVMNDSHSMKGMVAHVLKYKDMTARLLNSPVKQWLELTITDLIDNRVVFTSLGADNSLVNSNLSLSFEDVVTIGGKSLLFKYQPSQQFLDANKNWTLYWVIAGALVSLSLVCIFLLSMAGRIQRVASEVAEKTIKMQESESKYRRLIEGIQDDYIIYTRDIDGFFTYVSPSVEKILGYSRDVFQRQYANLIPRSKLNQLLDDHMLRTLTCESVDPYELEIFHKNGSIHTLKITENATRDSSGKVIGVEGIAHDITRDKKARLELEKLALAVSHSPNAVMITTREGIIEYVNPQFTITTGYEFEDVLGKGPDSVQSVLTMLSGDNKLWANLLAGKEWFGEFESRKKNETLYWSREHICPLVDDDGNVSHLVITQEDITESKRIHDETAHHASHDVLTGLINRREFELRLARIIKTAKTDASEHALCYMDLDQFKIVNDTCGHSAGDELLRQIGDLFLSTTRQRDTIARLGGDEFALLIEHCTIEQAYETCQKMIAALESFRFHWENHVFSVGVSIGLVIIDQDIYDSDQALNYVDSACYAAKDSGRNRVEVYIENSERLKQRKGEIQWNNEINLALEHDRFLLYVQPIKSLKKQDSGARYEVLLRLKMPDDTIALPSAFLPSAERYNSAIKIDQWVVDNTLKWLGQHPSELNKIETISINLSGQSLGDEAMLQFIVSEFKLHDVPANKIKFEITETAAIANLRNASVFMRTLSELGCGFALDDFGNGLSSFAYLKNLQVDTLKIDGMFVKDMLEDPIDYELVKSIHDIGHVMGLETIAEFVESEKVIEKLRDIGVDYVQGYHLGKPMPIDDIIKTKS